MPKFITKEGVTVVRDGKRIKPEIGKSFNYTQEEVNDLKRLRPQAIGIEPKVEEDARSAGDEKHDDPDPDDKGADDKGAGSKPATGKRGRPAASTSDAAGL